MKKIKKANFAFQVLKHFSVSILQKIVDFKLNQASKMLNAKGSFYYPSCGSCSNLSKVSGTFYVHYFIGKVFFNIYYSYGIGLA